VRATAPEREKPGVGVAAAVAVAVAVAVAALVLAVAGARRRPVRSTAGIGARESRSHGRPAARPSRRPRGMTLLHRVEPGSPPGASPASSPHRPRPRRARSPSRRARTAAADCAWSRSSSIASVSATLDEKPNDPDTSDVASRLQSRVSLHSRRPRAVPAASPGSGRRARAKCSRAECARTCWRWPDAGSSR